MLALLQEGLAGDGNSEYIASCTAGVMPADSAAVLSVNTDTDGMLHCFSWIYAKCIAVQSVCSWY